MFALQQINEIHDRLGKQASLPQYLMALKAIGIIKYDSFISDGHSEYFGKNNYKIVSPPVHTDYFIAQTCNRQEFLMHLKLHEEGKTDYLKMAASLAESGIEKWTFNTIKMTIAYYDKNGNEMLLEKID